MRKEQKRRQNELRRREDEEYRWRKHRGQEEKDYYNWRRRITEEIQWKKNKKDEKMKTTGRGEKRKRQNKGH